MEVRCDSDTARATVKVRNINFAFKQPFCDGQKRRNMKSRLFLSFILTLIFAIGVSAQTGTTVSGKIFTKPFIKSEKFSAKMKRRIEL